ncbi:MAG: BNR repeat-containing protein [Planctomycetota bacterium]
MSRLMTAASLTLLATLLSPPLALSQADSVTLSSDSVLDASALHLPGARWNTTVNGMAFQQPALISHLGHQYATWWDSERRLCVGRRELPTSSWEVIRFDDYRIRSDDTHNVTVVGICPDDGTIHLAFDHHNSPLHYRVSKTGAATEPESHAWTRELFGPVVDQLRPDEPIRRLTYPRFIQSPSGGLQMCFRLGASGGGDWYWVDYDTASGWGPHRMLISSKGDYAGSTSRCAYLNGFTYGPDGRLHLSWCWRETGDPMTNHDLHHVFSDDEGRSWLGSLGSVATLDRAPLSIDSQGVRFARIDMYRGLTNSTTQAVDGSGRLHIVALHLPSEEPSQIDWAQSRKKSRYHHYWRGEDGTWNVNPLPECGTRPQLVIGPKDRATLVFTGDRYFPDQRDLVVFAADAAEQWSNWHRVRMVPGPFTGQPQVDRTRTPDVLSVYIQEYPSDLEASSSALRVLDFDLRGSD